MANPHQGDNNDEDDHAHPDQFLACEPVKHSYQCTVGHAASGKAGSHLAGWRKDLIVYSPEPFGSTTG